MKAVVKHLTSEANGILKESRSHNTAIFAPTYCAFLDNFPLGKWKNNALLGEELLEKIAILNSQLLKWKQFSENELITPLITSHHLDPYKRIPISTKLTKKILTLLKEIAAELETLHKKLQLACLDP